MWRYYQPNPAGRSVGDCSVRAVSAALDVSWDEAFDLLAHNAREMCDMPSSDAVIGSQSGWKANPLAKPVSKTGKNCFSERKKLSEAKDNFPTKHA